MSDYDNRPYLNGCSQVTATNISLAYQYDRPYMSHNVPPQSRPQPLFRLVRASVSHLNVHRIARHISA